MKKDVTYISGGGDKFDRYLERKKHQSNEDQCFEAGVLVSELITVDTNKAYSALHNKINKRTKLRVIYIHFSKIAAILVLPLLFYTVWNQIRDRQPGEISKLSYQEISSPSGMRSKVVLPDGSKIWLNAESKIRYSIPFVRETRELELVGEAFLDVTRNPDSPLNVKFNQVTVSVLGTRFNVRAFPDDQQVEVVLSEGRIQLENDNRESGKDRISLKPGQQWVYNKTTHATALKEVDADKYIAWHRNILILDKTPMADVAKQLERWYGIKVEIRDGLLYKYKFTTVFENEPLQRVIELLEMSSPIRIRYLPGELNKETGEAEKSIIQISAK